MICSIFSYKNRIYKWIAPIFILLLNHALLAQLPDQNLNLNIRNKPIINVLEQISRQTGLLFTYNSEIIPQNKRVTLILDEIPLQEALDSIFNDPSFQFTLIDKNIVIYKTGIPDPERRILTDESIPKRIKGTVRDKVNKEALPFATILIQGTRKGTITNLRGEFTLVIPPGENPLLEVSMIGYKNNYIPLQANAEDSISIPLERDVISLQEVIIRYQNPVDILRKAISRIPGNYLNEHAAITAYFREYVQRNTEYISYSEAVIDIDKSPYNQLLTPDIVRLVKGRKLENIPSDDSLLLKIQSGVSSSLQLDIIKNIPRFLSSDFEVHHHLAFRNLMSYRGKQVYVISFQPLSNTDEAIYEGILYINSEDLAILAVEFNIVPEVLRREPERFMVRKSRYIKARTLKASYRAEYRKTDGKYHISMVSGEVLFRLRKRKEWLSSRYRISIEMAVTDIQPGFRNRIPRRERLKPGTILSEQEFSYDPSFWGEYNIIQPEASLRDAMKKMGIEWKDFEE